MIVCDVARTFVRQVDGLVIVEVGGQVIEATTEHPFWVVGSGWIAAKGLNVGHMLQTLDGDYLPVEDVCLRPGLVTVYNFEVADAHDYFVSDAEVLVHNNPCAQVASRVEGGLQLGRNLSKTQAVSHLKQGGDIYTASKRTARQLMTNASSTGRVIREVEKKSGFYSHFHDAVRELGHAFYGKPLP